jgi:hypothetical protein
MPIQLNEDAAALMGISSDPSKIGLLIAALEIAIALPAQSVYNQEEC